MRTIKWLLALLIVFAAVFAARYIVSNKPVAQGQRSETADKPVPVETLPLNRQNYTVQISSYGTIEAAREITVIAQVGGKITRIGDNFHDGASVAQGELLVQIDPADYRIAVKTAEATLAQARATLSEQAALSEQAIADWQRLGRRGEPSDLVARKPQLEAARAQVASASAQLERAQLDLARTTLTAPFNGVLSQTQGNTGQFIVAGASLGVLYDTSSYEARLPVSQRVLPFISIDGDTTRATLTDRDTGRHITAKVTRREATVDSRTRQVFLIAEVEADAILLGQFVDATIDGQQLRDVIVVESRYVRDDDSIVVFRDEIARRVPVEVVWRNDSVTLLASGPEPDDRLITTPLGPQADGLVVRLREDRPESQPALGESE